MDKKLTLKQAVEKLDKAYETFSAAVMTAYDTFDNSDGDFDWPEALSNINKLDDVLRSLMRDLYCEWVVGYD